MDRILLDWKMDEKRVAYLQNNKLKHLQMIRTDHTSIVGNIYIGIVREVVSGMNAAFVDIGLEKNAYLPFEETPACKLIKNEHLPHSPYVRQGEKIIVRVLRDPEGTKGAKISALIEFSGPGIVYIKGEHFVRTSKKADYHTVNKWKAITKRHLFPDEGVIVRTNFLDAEEERFQEYLEDFRNQFIRIQKKSVKMKAPAILVEQNPILKSVEKWTKESNGELIVNTAEALKLLDPLSAGWTVELYSKQEDLYGAFGLNEEIDKAVNRVVSLDNGADLVFDKTEAMHVVDVNSGKNIAIGSHRQTILESNMAAAKEIGRQIILRNLSGIILIDFINMKNVSDQKKVKQTLEASLKADPLQAKVVGFTELGLMQVTRKKEGADLYEWLLDPSSMDRKRSKEAEWYELKRELAAQQYNLESSCWIDAEPTFYTYISGQPKQLWQLAASYQKDLFITKADIRGTRLWEMRGYGDTMELINRINRQEEAKMKDKFIHIKAIQD